ncbi:MAG: hypothetical protein V3R69_02980 [candidate division NC10 bacterium]|jgi:hypothetical protein
MGRRHVCGVFGGFLTVLALGSLVAAASLDLPKARDGTEKFTKRNVSTLFSVSSAVPDEFRIKVIEIIQTVEISRDRIILYLDRIEKGVFPPDEGVKRVKAIAKASAHKEEELLRALMARVPAPVVPKIENALTVSTESWEGVLAAFQLSKEEEEPDLPPRPRSFDIMFPPGVPVSPPP